MWGMIKVFWLGLTWHGFCDSVAPSPSTHAHCIPRLQRGLAETGHEDASVCPLLLCTAVLSSSSEPHRSEIKRLRKTRCRQQHLQSKWSIYIYYTHTCTHTHTHTHTHTDFHRNTHKKNTTPRQQHGSIKKYKITSNSFPNICWWESGIVGLKQTKAVLSQLIPKANTHACKQSDTQTKMSQCKQYDYILFLRFYLYIFVALVKCDVLTLVSEIQCYINDCYYYYYY